MTDSRGPSERQECMAFYDWYLLQRGQFLTPCLIVHIANEGSYSKDRRPAFGAMLKRMGKVAGTPDYVCVTPSAGFFIEFKSRTGTMQPNQKAFFALAEESGIGCHLVRSADEAIVLLRGKGIAP